MRTTVASTSLRLCATLLASLAMILAAPPSWSAEKPVVIRLWDHHVHDKKFRQNIFKEFNKANPEVKVEYTSQVSSSYMTVLDAAVRSGNPPEIFIPMGEASLPKLIEMGWVKPLDDVAPSKEALAKWIAQFPPEQKPFAENINVYGGKVYSWPIRGEGAYLMLFWNTKLFEQAGLKGSDGRSLVPETWDEMRSFAKKITELGSGKIYGIVHGIKDPGVWVMDLTLSVAQTTGWQNGGFDWRTGRFDYHYAGFRAAVQLWLDMQKDGSVFPGDLSMDDEQARFRFAQDLAGMVFGGPWVPGGLLAINDALQFDTTLPPTPKKGERKGFHAIGPLANNFEYVVSSKVTSKEANEAVWKVIEFMGSQQYQEGWVQAGGGISVFPQYNKTEYFPHPTLAKIAQLGGAARRTTPESVLPPGLWAKVWEHAPPVKPDEFDTMQGMWIGKLGWDAWDDLENRYNQSLDAGIEEARKRGVKVSRSDFTFPDWDPTENYPRRAAPYH